MALVVFLRGVNVGGHRTFRPSIVARELRDYDIVNIGAAGTFVVRKPGRSPATFRARLLRKLPIETEVMLCDGRDLLRLETENPFGPEAPSPDVVRFVSILLEGRCRSNCPPRRVSAGGRVARPSHRFERPIRLRDVPPQHEDDFLPWEARRSFRFAGDHAQLEHDHGRRANPQRQKMNSADDGGERGIRTLERSPNFVAEREGFELSRGSSPLLAFQASAFGRSTTSPPELRRASGGVALFR